MANPVNELFGRQSLVPIAPYQSGDEPARSKTDREIYEEAKTKSLDQISDQIGVFFQGDIGSVVKDYLPASLEPYPTVADQQFCSPILGEVLVECREGYRKQIASLTLQLRERNIDSAVIEIAMRNIIMFNLLALKGELDQKNPNLLEKLGLVSRVFVYDQQPSYRSGYDRRFAAVEPARKTFRDIFIDALGRNYTDFDDTVNSIKTTFMQTGILTAREFTERYSKPDESLKLDERTQQFVTKFFEATKSNFIETAEYRRRLQDLNGDRDAMKVCLQNLATPSIISIKTQLESDLEKHPYCRHQFQEVFEGVAAYRI